MVFTILSKKHRDGIHSPRKDLHIRNGIYSQVYNFYREIYEVNFKIMNTVSGIETKVKGVVGRGGGRGQDSDRSDWGEGGMLSNSHQLQPTKQYPLERPQG